ncbi:MAG: hypothetical protein OXF20_04855 [Gammaproteobacteria bacterium]|nr:hypothetical protein [Gammaproteobacteria bacterium]
MDHGTTCREMRRSASAMIREWQADQDSGQSESSPRSLLKSARFALENNPF